VMSKDLITIDPGASLREAARIMTEKWIRHLPVLEGGKLIGIVSQRDLAGMLAGALNEPEELHRLIEGSELVRERRLKRIEAGDLD
jgi:CBS domain-containing protein